MALATNKMKMRLRRKKPKTRHRGRHSRRSRRHHRGGNMVAKGSYGCVFKPPLKCKGKPNRIDGYVSKLMTREHAENEINEQDEVDEIDPDYNFHLKVGEVCVPEVPDEPTDDLLRGCYLHGFNLNDIYDQPHFNDYVNVHLEDGGVGLYDFLRTSPEMKNDKKCELMLYDFTRILFGLNEFFKNKMGHFDIKTNNIVYDVTKNRFNYIDFGYTSTYADFLDEHIDWGKTYFVNPVERIVANFDTKTVIEFVTPCLNLARSTDTLEQIASNNLSADNKTHYDSIATYLHKYAYDGNKEEYSMQFVNAWDSGEYGMYGFDSSNNPSPQMISDYVEWFREFDTKFGPIKDVDAVKEHLQLMVLSKLNTFSLGIAMIEMLHYMTVDRPDYKEIVINYGGDLKLYQEYRESLEETELVITGIRKFYELILMMCVPTFSKRISTEDALAFYKTHIYEPLQKKHGLEPMKFLDAKQLVKEKRDNVAVALKRIPKDEYFLIEEPDDIFFDDLKLTTEEKDKIFNIIMEANANASASGGRRRRRRHRRQRTRTKVRKGKWKTHRRYR